ncbi:hypothetical protein HDF08_000395 [Edaphobacter lichenicola]|uniref:Uncharacterized protein n=1 Tax=Tunturiibacter lichenicola TaxID=2051959 RepID=A0A852V5M7_9BACT|nr:hypothetical protein [Edaphobacter lichenicola]
MHTRQSVAANPLVQSKLNQVAHSIAYEASVLFIKSETLTRCMQAPAPAHPIGPRTGGPGRPDALRDDLSLCKGYAETQCDLDVAPTVL